MFLDRLLLSYGAKKHKHTQTQTLTSTREINKLTVVKKLINDIILIHGLEMVYTLLLAHQDSM